jgi:hypothetical protein
MKLGIIFKKQYERNKIEIYGDEITIKREGDALLVEAEKDNSVITQKRRFPVHTIQLIYLGEWNT